MSSQQQQISVQQLYILRRQLDNFMNRSSIEIQQQDLYELDSHFIQHINLKFHSENQIIKNIAYKLNDFIGCWICNKKQQKWQIQQLHNLIQQKCIQIDNLQQIVAHFEKKVQNYEYELQKLKNVINTDKINYKNLQRQYDKLQMKINNNEKQIQKLLLKQKYYFNIFINQKEILINQIKSQKIINTKLKDQIIKLESYSNQLPKVESNQNQTIESNQSSRIESTPKMNMNNQNSYFITKIAQTEIDKKFVLGSNNSQIDYIPYKKQSLPFQLHPNFTDFNLNNCHYLDDASSGLKMSMDPYFAHFVLTSQSVKIKEDCQQFLGIDAKPYYPQIVEKRVPMHLWDQWIRNKLREVLKLRRQQNSQNSEEQR